MQVAGHEHVDADTDDDDREHDRRATAARTERPSSESSAHRPSTKPEPRTVSISDGSPSLRRRYET